MVFIEELQTGNVKVDGYPIDITRRKDVFNAVQKADAIKPIDILINNAGIAFETPFLNITEQEWKQILDVNLTGMFFVAQAVCRHMAIRKKKASSST